jgi:hypothetical protein
MPSGREGAVYWIGFFTVSRVKYALDPIIHGYFREGFF